jgi:hypothetical protein
MPHIFHTGCWHAICHTFVNRRCGSVVSTSTAAMAMKGIMLKKFGAAALLSLAALVTFPMPTAADTHVSVGVNIGVFHERLSPYGEWISVGHYGSCWRPRHVRVGWRPYTIGYWAYTDYGWEWVSEEDWGWATYHYGRWFFDPDYGWVWVPGRTWAPAYVAWRYGDDWIGWAPLPPGINVSFSLNADRFLQPSAYTFVQAQFFTDRQLGAHIAPESRNSALIGTTRNITHYDVRGSRIINRGVDTRVIERASGRPVGHERIARTDPSTVRPNVNGGRERSRATIDRSHANIDRPHAARPLEHGRVQGPVERHQSRAAVEAPRGRPTHEPSYRSQQSSQHRPQPKHDVASPRGTVGRDQPRVDHRRVQPSVERRQVQPRVEHRQVQPRVEHQRVQPHAQQQRVQPRVESHGRPAPQARPERPKKDHEPKK